MTDITQHSRQDPPRPGGIWYLWAALLPIVGFVLGVVAMARGHVGPGFALWITAFFASWGWAILISLITLAGSSS